MAKKEELVVPQGWEETWAATGRAVDEVNAASKRDFERLKARAAAGTVTRTLGEALSDLLRLSEENPDMSLSEALKRLED